MSVTPINTPMALGVAVVASRRTLGLTQPELALAAGVGVRFIMELEAGKPTVRMCFQRSLLYGPGLAQAFVLLRSATRPSAPNTLKLLDEVVFNALIGNHDAHGKNFSLLYTQAGAVLTPLCDALCTAVYPALTDKMAMKIGSKYKFSGVQARHWEQFATEAALSPEQVKKRVADIAKRLPELARATQARFQSEGNSHPIIGQIVTLIEQRCALTLRRLIDPSVESTHRKSTAKP